MTIEDTRERLYRLIDNLPESELYAAERLLDTLCAGHDPALHALLEARLADIDETFAQQVTEFIQQYRSALETLARV